MVEHTSRCFRVSFPSNIVLIPRGHGLLSHLGTILPILQVLIAYCLWLHPRLL